MQDIFPDNVNTRIASWNFISHLDVSCALLSIANSPNHHHRICNLWILPWISSHTHKQQGRYWNWWAALVNVCFIDMCLGVIRSIGVPVSCNQEHRSSSCIQIFIHNTLQQNAYKWCILFTSRLRLNFPYRKTILLGQLWSCPQRLLHGVSNVWHWVKHFKDANGDIADLHHISWTRTSTMEYNEQRVNALITEDRRVMTWEISLDTMPCRW
jgi:hypothetical protein